MSAKSLRKILAQVVLNMSDSGALSTTDTLSSLSMIAKASDDEVKTGIKIAKALCKGADAVCPIIENLPDD